MIEVIPIAAATPAFTSGFCPTAPGDDQGVAHTSDIGGEVAHLVQHGHCAVLARRVVAKFDEVHDGDGQGGYHQHRVDACAPRPGVDLRRDLVVEAGRTPGDLVGQVQGHEEAAGDDAVGVDHRVVRHQHVRH